MLDTPALTTFIIAAKKATYLASGSPAASSRRGSHDLTFDAPPYVYRDSYYGYILRPELITPSEAGRTLKAALSQAHAQGRLLDNFQFENYAIASQGIVSHFSGIETITVKGIVAYQLDYHGGLITP
jgi:acetaldehyde dehydrogenase (acetylating)